MPYPLWWLCSTPSLECLPNLAPRDAAERRVRSRLHYDRVATSPASQPRPEHAADPQPTPYGPRALPDELVDRAQDERARQLCRVKLGDCPHREDAALSRQQRDQGLVHLGIRSDPVRQQGEVPYDAAPYTATVERIDGGYRVHVAANGVVRDLTLLSDRIAPDAEVDDALVSLLPGERGVFTVRTAAELDVATLTSPLVLRSVNQLVG